MALTLSVSEQSLPRSQHDDHTRVPNPREPATHPREPGNNAAASSNPTAGPRSLQHAGSVLQALHEMQQQHEMCDMQVVAEGEPVQVHSLVLAACSSYFRSLLCTSKSGDWQTLDMPRISKKNLKVLITYAYTGVLDVTTENVKEIQHTCLLYGFTGATQICERYVQEHCKDKPERRTKKHAAPAHRDTNSRSSQSSQNRHGNREGRSHGHETVTQRAHGCETVTRGTHGHGAVTQRMHGHEMVSQRTHGRETVTQRPHGCETVTQRTHGCETVTQRMHGHETVSQRARGHEAITRQNSSSLHSEIHGQEAVNQRGNSQSHSCERVNQRDQSSSMFHPNVTVHNSSHNPERVNQMDMRAMSTSAFHPVSARFPENLSRSVELQRRPVLSYDRETVIRNCSSASTYEDFSRSGLDLSQSRIPMESYRFPPQSEIRYYETQNGALDLTNSTLNKGIRKRSSAPDMMAHTSPSKLLKHAHEQTAAINLSMSNAERLQGAMATTQESARSAVTVGAKQQTFAVETEINKKQRSSRKSGGGTGRFFSSTTSNDRPRGNKERRAGSKICDLVNAGGAKETALVHTGFNPHQEKLVRASDAPNCPNTYQNFTEKNVYTFEDDSDSLSVVNALRQRPRVSAATKRSSSHRSKSGKKSQSVERPKVSAVSELSSSHVPEISNVHCSPVDQLPVISNPTSQDGLGGKAKASEKSRKRSNEQNKVNKERKGVEKFGNKPFLRSHRLELLKMPLLRQEEREVEMDTGQSGVHAAEYSAVTAEEREDEVPAEFLRAMNLKRRPIKTRPQQQTPEVMPASTAPEVDSLTMPPDVTEVPIHNTTSAEVQSVETSSPTETELVIDVPETEGNVVVDCNSVQSAMSQPVVISVEEENEPSADNDKSEKTNNLPSEKDKASLSVTMINRDNELTTLFQENEAVEVSETEKSLEEESQPSAPHNDVEGATDETEKRNVETSSEGKTSQNTQVDDTVESIDTNVDMKSRSEPMQIEPPCDSGKHQNQLPSRSCDDQPDVSNECEVTIATESSEPSNTASEEGRSLAETNEKTVETAETCESANTHSEPDKEKAAALEGDCPTESESKIVDRQERRAVRSTKASPKLGKGVSSEGKSNKVSKVAKKTEKRKSIKNNKEKTETVKESQSVRSCKKTSHEKTKKKEVSVKEKKKESKKMPHKFKVKTPPKRTELSSKVLLSKSKDKHDRTVIKVEKLSPEKNKTEAKSSSPKTTVKRKPQVKDKEKSKATPNKHIELLMTPDGQLVLRSGDKQGNKQDSSETVHQENIENSEKENVSKEPCSTEETCPMSEIRDSVLEKTDTNANRIHMDCKDSDDSRDETESVMSTESRGKKLRGKNVQIGKCVRCKLRFVDEASYRSHANICKGALHQSYYRVPKTEHSDEDVNSKLQSTSDYKYMCDMCGHQAHRPNQLDVHKYSKHGIPYDPNKYEVIKCEERGCNYMTIKNASMREHIYNCHSGKMPFICEQCGKCFRRKIGLKLHLRTHGIGAQPAACNLCGLTFKQKGNLRAHVQRVHLGEKPYVCAHCHYSSFTRFDLDYHKLKRHSIPLPKSKISRHICEVCDFIARTKFDLDKHRRIHTGERPYECKICNNSYFTANSLKTHVLVVHTTPGDRPFKCTYADCDFGAISKSKLKEHVRSIHTKEKPYVCSHCGYRAAIKGNLTKHIQKKHSQG